MIILYQNLHLGILIVGVHAGIFKKSCVSKTKSIMYNLIISMVKIKHFNKIIICSVYIYKYNLR